MKSSIDYNGDINLTLVTMFSQSRCSSPVEIVCEQKLAQGVIDVTARPALLRRWLLYNQ